MKYSNNGLPNIVMIVLDTTRAQSLSCYGCEELTTPHLDTLAETAVLYEDAISPSPWTLPAHASLFTGLYPSFHQTDGHRPFLSPALPTFAEAMGHFGYETFGVSNNVWISDSFGMDRGFQKFIKTWQIIQREHDIQTGLKDSTPSKLGAKAKYLQTIKLILQGNVGANVVNAAYGKSLRYSRDDGAARTNQLVNKWVSERNEADPFFLFINYMEPHAPYQPNGIYRELHVPQGASKESIDRVRRLSRQSKQYHSGVIDLTPDDFALMRTQYLGAISYLDHMVNDLLDSIRTRYDWDNTLVIIMGDHGENIGDHGLMAHRFSVHETLVRVPLIIKYPFSMVEPGRVRSRVQLVDILPTVIDLLQQTSGKTNAHILPGNVQGRSLLEEKSDERVAVAEYNSVYYSPEAQDLATDFENSKYNRTLKAVYRDNYKMIVASDGEHELYDLAADPAEVDNLFTPQSTIAANMIEQLESWYQQKDTSFSVGDEMVNVDIDSTIEHRLRDLGYL